MCFTLLGLKTQTGSNILFVYMCLMINVSNLMDEAPEIDARASELHKFHGFFFIPNSGKRKSKLSPYKMLDHI